MNGYIKKREDMSLSISDLKIIAGKGEGLILDAKSIPVSDLKIIVSKAQITLKNPQVLNTSDLKVIASKSKGCVVFDFYDTKQTTNITKSFSTQSLYESK